MSILSIFVGVWGDGVRMTLSFLMTLLSLKALSKSDSVSTLLLASSAKHEDSATLTDGRSRPAWMSHGMVKPHHLEDHTEPFPCFDVGDSPEREAAAMRAAHEQNDLLLPAHPLFRPDLAPLDAKFATMATNTLNTGDIFMHEKEAHDALRTALTFAAGKARSRYQFSHPAFTNPSMPRVQLSSPLLLEMKTYIANTFQGCRGSIRVASPRQIYLELETYLLLAFTSYVLSRDFEDSKGKNKILPAFLVAELKKSYPWGFFTAREILESCEDGMIDGAEEFLSIWVAWRWVAKIYVGLLVLRHKRRESVRGIVWS